MAFGNKVLRQSVLAGWCLIVSAGAQATLPVSHLKGVDDLFADDYRIYSPLSGLLHQSLVLANGDLKSQQAVLLNQVESALFVKLNEGEVVPSHMFSNPAANLSGATVAKIFVEFEKIKDSFGSELKRPDVVEEAVAQLQQKILSVIKSDSAYLGALQEAKANQEIARNELVRVQKLIAEQPELEKKAEEFKKKNLSPIYAQIKAIKAQIKNNPDATCSDLTELEKQKAQHEKTYDAMRSGFLKAADRSSVLSRLENQIQTNETEGPAYQTKLREFTQALAQSFLSLDLTRYSPSEFPNATTNALLSFLWMKWDEKSELASYLEVFAKANFVEKSEWSRVDRDFYTNYFSETDYADLLASFTSAWSKAKWVSENFASSVAFVTDVGNVGAEALRAPKIVPFSYTNWVTYNPLFPDCTENGIHNLFNLIVFNPSTGAYDVEILRKLKAQFYPNLDESVIAYYSKYKTNAEHNTREAKRAWVKIMYKLNDGFESLSKESKIKYVRGDHELSASYQNITKVINRLMGISDWSQDNFAKIFEDVSKVSGINVHYERTEISSKVHRGTFDLGSSAVQMTSYGNLHCTFKKVKNLKDKRIQDLLKILRDKTKTHTKKGESKTLRYQAVSEYLKTLE